MDGYWEELYEKVKWEGIALSGYYNRNYLVGSRLGQVVVRIPIASAPQMDYMALPEPLVMKAAREYGVPVPEVHYVSEEPQFQVHEYLKGRTLEAWIREYSMKEVLPFIASMMVKVWSVNPQEFLSYQPNLIPSDPLRLWDELTGFYQELYERYYPKYHKLYQEIGVPEKPFELDFWKQDLVGREWKFCHCDIHPGNLIIGDRLWLLDWALALVTDPAWDLALHLHKMRYRPELEAAFLEELGKIYLPSLEPDFRADVARYRGLEQAKSVIVDVVRNTQEILESDDYKAQTAAAEKLAERLKHSERFWYHDHWTPEALRLWALDHRGDI